MSSEKAPYQRAWSSENQDIEADSLLRNKVGNCRKNANRTYTYRHGDGHIKTHTNNDEENQQQLPDTH